MAKIIGGILDMNGLLKISAENYEGKFCKVKIYLRELGLKESYFS
jgi:formylmethanofuran:tetrahydromethanopterin formyltransferase